MKDKILEALIEKYKERAERGMLKYGTTLDRDDLQLLDWINHAQEEAMDYCLYLEKIKHILNDRATDTDKAH
jgi:succinate dehydrogenase flavin-adding protein (antitoxin of CptAB toxin-antitoxin module)